jgi:hypothetical protein
VQFEDDFETMNENDEQERVEKQQEDGQMSGQEEANGLGEIRTESTATMTAMRLKAQTDERSQGSEWTQGRSEQNRR